MEFKPSCDFRLVSDKPKNQYLHTLQSNLTIFIKFTFLLFDI